MTKQEEASDIRTRKRILNEYRTKILNEEHLEKVVERRKDTDMANHRAMVFQCECDDTACAETISMSPEEFARMHPQTTNFIVVPSHVQLDLEVVISTFSSYVVVKKSGTMP